MVLLQPDPSTALVGGLCVYKVGSRDEQDTKTGIAHLFEHLMFDGNNGPGLILIPFSKMQVVNAMLLPQPIRPNIILYLPIN